ncbi:hypothetical protein AJ80_05785 [Polytolypa hystricis UAMH7299]|uniref:Peptide N-acetyl-beta-D-glucosaminyl asparaginase amidase A N-terminal domain-containing protein n=1 Tax=Polytolypa hystricis (strain UAMH7299) TaxID=1447883 RepID=A0A2B7Y115_POLH7|nr:hypothetical protein AJ80_05785 [Polytolypa hystricis UAMH7299]
MGALPHAKVRTWQRSKSPSCWRIYRTLAIVVLFLGIGYLIGKPFNDAILSSLRKLQLSKPSRAGGVLDVFQVYKPLDRTADDGVGHGCDLERLLMEHEFGWSYGHPFVGRFEPPDCDFNTVTMNLTVTSKGRQFDRLALMFLGDIEVFRTSTAEPTSNGIIWTYMKDMSAYNSLWREPQKVIFDLGNLIDDTYTAPFYVILTATFSMKAEPPRVADAILPISARRAASDAPSAFSLPSDNAITAHVIPNTTIRAVVSLAACGQATEEFWYSNVLSSDIDTFTDTVGKLNGFSPFREVQLYIDDQLAGIDWPFPIIFTGGIAPGFWRPMVGIDAFDLREPEIDITPFLPLITDGRPHTFSINVVGLDDAEDGSATLSKSVGSYWVVTGKIFLYHDDSPAATVSIPGFHQGSPPLSTSKLDIKISHSREQDAGTGVNESLSYTVRVSRSLRVKSPQSSWLQFLTYSNAGHLTERGITQRNNQRTDFTALSPDKPRNGMTVDTFSRSGAYHIAVNSTYTKTDQGFSIRASLRRGLKFLARGGNTLSVFTLAPGVSVFEATQYGNASYTSVRGKGSFSSGDTTERFKEISRGEIYRKLVRAVNGSVMLSENGSLPVLFRVDGWDGVSGRDGVRAILGRGPE